MKKIIFIVFLTLLTSLYADNFEVVTSDDTIIHAKDLEKGLLFEEYRGKPVLLVLFGHRCSPCMEEIPKLIKFKNKYKDKLEIVAIEVQGYNKEQLENFKKAKGINYNLVPRNNKNDAFLQNIMIRSGWEGAIPFLIALDKNGEVNDIITGLAPKNKLEELVKTLIK